MRDEADGWFNQLRNLASHSKQDVDNYHDENRAFATETALPSCVY